MNGHCTSHARRSYIPRHTNIRTPTYRNQRTVVAKAFRVSVEVINQADFHTRFAGECSKRKRHTHTEIDIQRTRIGNGCRCSLNKYRQLHRIK